MVTLRNPEAPATKAQLWLLHVLTKEDTRNLNITMSEASKQIAELKAKPVNSKRPLVNPHASAIKQDKQKITQAKYDKKHTGAEIEFIQGEAPNSQTDLAKVEADFMANAYAIGRQKAGNDTAKVDFYDFQCKECLFGQSGICEPKWQSAGAVTCAGKVESISFDCANHEPLKYSISDYCWRPKGKQCHRQKIENKCLECSCRSKQFRMDYGNNRNAWANYIPTIADRIKSHEYFLNLYTNPSEHFKDIDYTSAIANQQDILRLLNVLYTEQVNKALKAINEFER